MNALRLSRGVVALCILLSRAACRLEATSDQDMLRGRIFPRDRAEWRREKALAPCFGCIRGEPILYQRMFENCSYFTFGQEMGLYPTSTNLTISCNDTILLALIGSRLYFHSNTALYHFLAEFTNSTCPETRPRNISEICSGDGNAPCMLYDVRSNEQWREMQEKGDEEVDWGPRGLYGPGVHTFSFEAFENHNFPYAFWTVQYLSLFSERRANVTINGAFANHPPKAQPPMLINAFFICAIVILCVYSISSNSYIGSRAVDVANRIPWVRRRLITRGRRAASGTVSAGVSPEGSGESRDFPRLEGRCDDVYRSRGREGVYNVGMNMSIREAFGLPKLEEEEGSLRESLLADEEREGG